MKKNNVKQFFCLKTKKILEKDYDPETFPPDIEFALKHGVFYIYCLFLKINI